MVLLEEGREGTVLGKGYDGGVVGEEGHQRAQGRCAGKVEKRLHKYPEAFFQHLHHAKLREKFGKRARKDRYAHKIEHRVEQQGMGGVHYGVYEVPAAHNISQGPEYCCKQGQEYKCLHKGAM